MCLLFGLELVFYYRQKDMFSRNTSTPQYVIPGYRFNRIYLGFSSDLNKRIYFFKRVRGGSKIFRALRAPAHS